MSLLSCSDHSPLSWTEHFLTRQEEIKNQTWVTTPPKSPKPLFVSTECYAAHEEVWFLNTPTKQETARRLVSGLRCHDYLGREVVAGEYYNADCWANHGSIWIRRTEAEVEALMDEREREEEQDDWS